jgi:hypothetical protein
MSVSNQALVKSPPPSTSLQLSYAEIKDLAISIADSGYFADAVEASQAVVKVMYGRELGISPMASMSNVYIVKGRPSLSALLIGAIIRRSGVYDFRVLEHTNKKCVIEFVRRTGPGTSEILGVSPFTIEDAVTAGLAHSETYKKYPRNMLYSRAMSNGARWYTPDIFGGAVYTPDELDARTVLHDDGTITVPAESVTVKSVDSPDSTKIKTLALEVGYELSDFLAKRKVTSLEDLSRDERQNLINLLETRKETQKSITPDLKPKF